MNIDIISIFPEMFSSFFSCSIIKRAQNFGNVKINIHNLRDYSLDKHKKTDNHAYGGIPGMVMSIEPIDRCISSLKSNTTYDDIIYMAPDGEKLTQSIANELSLKENIIILCGHYKGIDERIREHLITREISIGEYVVSGGEIPACVLVDSIVRLIPGVISDITSALDDSFQDDLISYPVYTKPRQYKTWEVPEILLSGDKKKISEWLLEKSIERTKKYKMTKKSS